MNFLEKYFLIFLSVIYLQSCSTLERKLISTDEINKKTLLVFVLSNGEELSGAQKNFFKGSSFESANINWNSTNYSKNTLSKSLEGIFSKVEYVDTSGSLDKSFSFQEFISNSSKVSQKDFDYYLFLVPQTPNLKKHTSGDFFGNCSNVYCLPLALIYITGDLSYKGLNKFLNIFTDERAKSFAEDGKKKLQFKIVSQSHNDEYYTSCFTGLDLILVKRNEKKFAAYAKMNYDSAIESNLNKEQFTSFDNFSDQQKNDIRSSCLNAISYSINRGLYDMKIIK